VGQDKNIKVIDVKTRSIRETKRILNAGLDGTEGTQEVHFNIFRKFGLIEKLRFCVNILCIRYWLMMESVDYYVLGVIHKTANTEIFIPLQRNVLIYVNTVTFKSSDSRLRTFLKYITTLALGWLTWNQDVRIVVSLKKKKQSHGSGIGMNSNGTGLLSFVTPDREISFIFIGNEKRPHEIRKCGPLESIRQEYQNHSMASRVLGDKVPTILEFKTGGNDGCLFIEYVEERTLINLVANEYSNKLDTFVREAVKHLEFCYEVYKNFVKYVPIVRRRITGKERQEIFELVETLSERSSDKAVLHDIVNQAEGLRIPRVIQHNDFCVRNILIRKNGLRVLIDWEDMREECWPLADYMMLCMSLEEAFSILFPSKASSIRDLQEYRRSIGIFENELRGLLRLSKLDFQIVKMLSQLSLFKQNLSKKRYDTAYMIAKNAIGQMHNLCLD